MNNLVVATLFKDATCLGNVVVDARQQQTIDVYHGMRVMITYNQDNSACVVNGEFATVVEMTAAQVTAHLEARGRQWLSF